MRVNEVMVAHLKTYEWLTTTILLDTNGVYNSLNPSLHDIDVEGELH